jgi:hypothetical protein
MVRVKDGVDTLVYVETLNLYIISYLWAKGKNYKP